MTNDKKPLVGKLIVIVALMFGFGYALVPLYEVFCKVTGFGGKVDIVEQSAVQTQNDNRVIEVTFTAHTSTGLAWEFKPITKLLQVKVGEINTAKFYVKNSSNKPITGMATFNVTPPRAGFHFKKTECFCFTQQLLQAGEEKQVEVRFMLDKELPKDVPELTLSYTFFNNEKYVDK